MTPDASGIDASALASQVLALQTVVYGLQQSSANTSPSAQLPPFAPSSIPTVSGVQILSQKPVANGTQIVVGFMTPTGLAANAIDHYDIWIQAGATNPFVAASVTQSPATILIPTALSSTTSTVGVRTAMKNGTGLAYAQCPTTTFNLVSASAITLNATGQTLPATTSTPVTGLSTTISSAGTYVLFLTAQTVNSGASSSACSFYLYKNSVQVGNLFLSIPIYPNTVASTQNGAGMVIFSAAVGDTVNINAAVATLTTVSIAANVTNVVILKQFST
jgi:hypothetical protein